MLAVCRRRKPPDMHERLPFQNALNGVESQQIARDLNNISQWLNQKRLAHKAEVVVPAIGTRVEKANQRLGCRKQRGDVGSLVSITDGASVGQVVENSRSAVLFFGNDMVDLATEKRIVLMDSTILTCASRALLNIATKPNAYVASHLLLALAHAALTSRIKCSAWMKASSSDRSSAVNTPVFSRSIRNAKRCRISGEALYPATTEGLSRQRRDQRFVRTLES